MLSVACLPYLAAWIITSFSSNALWMLYLARILVGASHALVTTTVYTVEVTAKELRATLSLWESVLRLATEFYMVLTLTIECPGALDVLLCTAWDHF